MSAIRTSPRTNTPDGDRTNRSTEPATRRLTTETTASFKTTHRS